MIIAIADHQHALSCRGMQGVRQWLNVSLQVGTAVHLQPILNRQPPTADRPACPPCLRHWRASSMPSCQSRHGLHCDPVLAVAACAYW